MSDSAPVDPERGQDLLDRLATFQFSRPAAPPPARRITGNTTRNAQLTRLVMTGCMNRPAWEIDPSRGALGPPTRPRKRSDFFVADTAVFQAVQPSELAGMLEDQPFDWAVAARMLWLDRVWFARLGVLTSSCPVTARWWRSKRIAMERCPGRYGLFETPADRYPCNVRGLCPWCWARDAVKDAQRIEATFFPQADGALRRRPHVPPARPRLRRGLREGPGRRARQATRHDLADQGRRRPVQAHTSSRRSARQVRPVRAHADHPAALEVWRVDHPGPPGHLHPAGGAAAGPGAHARRRGHQLRPVREPGAIPGAAYRRLGQPLPSYLLRGDPSRVFHALAAREGIQSSITAGVFRGARKRGGLG